jgi:hypothetical protein
MVYHPLNTATPLFELWRTAVARGASVPLPVPHDVAKRYLAHVGARLAMSALPAAASVPGVLEEDGRQSVRDFRAFFPAFMEHIGAHPDLARIPISFPTLDIFDGRVVETRGATGIFLSSRLLDVIDVFARAVTLNVRIFDRILRDSTDGAQSLVMPTWYPLLDVGLKLEDLTRNPTARVRAEVFRAPAEVAPENRTGYGRRQLTHYVAQAMFFVMERLVSGGPDDAAACIGALRSGGGSTTCPGLDARYLATMALTFIVLHEHAHLAYGHNSNEPLVENPQINVITEGLLRFAKDHPEIEPIDLRQSTQRVEQEADCFPFEVVSEDFREPLLEAASLWLAALAIANRGGRDWLHAAFATKGRGYPQYAMRVWFLNGKYGASDRSSDVNVWVRRAAESVEEQPSTSEMALAIYLPIIQEVWRIGEAEGVRPLKHSS